MSVSLYDQVRHSKTLPLIEDIRRRQIERLLSESLPYVSPLHFMEAEGQEQGKTLRFMIAAPGAGKSTWIKQNHPGAHIASADKFPGLYTPAKEPGGTPDIDFSKLQDAHAFSQKSANDAMASGHPHVVVDNTNTAAWQLRPYLKMAAKHGYNVKMTHLTAPLEDIRARGTHFPRTKPGEGEEDRLAGMKEQADSFAKQLHDLKGHPAPFRHLDKKGALHMPWEGDEEGQVPRGDHSDLHHLNYDIESHDTSDTSSQKAA